MTEHTPENLEVTVMPGVAIDRATLDRALSDMDAAAVIERVGECGTRRSFVLRALMDARSGRILQATTREGEELVPGPDQHLITVRGTFTQQADAKGQVTEETLAFERTQAPPPRSLSDTARVNLQKLLETWREGHNRYIANP